jgi:hypothetical protein
MHRPPAVATSRSLIAIMWARTCTRKSWFDFRFREKPGHKADIVERPSLTLAVL